MRYEIRKKAYHDMFTQIDEVIETVDDLDLARKRRDELTKNEPHTYENHKWDDETPIISYFVFDTETNEYMDLTEYVDMDP